MGLCGSLEPTLEGNKDNYQADVHLKHPRLQVYKESRTMYGILIS